MAATSLTFRTFSLAPPSATLRNRLSRKSNEPRPAGSRQLASRASQSPNRGIVLPSTRSPASSTSHRLSEDLVALGEPGLFVGTQPKHWPAAESNTAFTVSKPESPECNLSATEIFCRGKEARRRRCQDASQRSADAAFGGKDRSGGWSRSRIVRAGKSRSG
jgi:hypothetical protein